MAETLVDVLTLETILQRLGQCVRHQATLYLVGGTALLLAAGKTSTFDIDVQFSTANEHPANFIRCLRTARRTPEDNSR